MKKSPLLLAAALLLLTQPLFAWEAQTDQVVGNLHKNYPGSTFNSVTPSLIAGIYEVEAGKNKFYTDVNARVFIFGEMFDPYSLVAGGTASNQDGGTGEGAHVQQQKMEWSRLPLEDAFKIVKGDGSKRLAVFTDPDCPYCQKLNKELEGLDDVTIYFFPYPIAHPPARAKIDAAWCAENPQRAWEMISDGYIIPARGACPTSPVDRNLALGRSFGILGTPFLFAENGKSIPGWAPRAAIQRLFQ